MKTNHQKEESPKFAARQDKSYDRLEHERQQAEAAKQQPQPTQPPPANTIERDGKQIVVTDPVPPAQVVGGTAIAQGNRNAPIPPENLVEDPMDKARVEAFKKGKEENVHQAEVALENARRE